MTGQNARRASSFSRVELTDGYGQGATKSNPGIVNGQCQTADAEQTVLTVQLVAMARGVDNLARLGDKRDSSVASLIRDAHLLVAVARHPLFLHRMHLDELGRLWLAVDDSHALGMYKHKGWTTVVLR